MITATDIQVSLVVSASSAEAFNRICQVDKWWTSDLVGDTAALGAKFTVRFADTFVDFRITEFSPGKSVLWHADDSCVPWLKDDAEWTGTTTQFLLTETPDGTRIDFTHFGLTPEVECYADCTQGWEYFLLQSLRALIEEGTGSPAGVDLHQILTVDATPSEAFEAICNVPGWFSSEFEGASRSAGDLFTVRFGETHKIECKVRTLVLGRRIVWEVADAVIGCLDDPAAWAGNTLYWLVRPVEGGAEIRFAHKGLQPGSKVFADCERGWEYFLRESLTRLISEGKGRPGLPVLSGESHE